MRVADDGVGGVDPSVGGGLARARRPRRDRRRDARDRQPGRRRHAAAGEAAGMRRRGCSCSWLCSWPAAARRRPCASRTSPSPARRAPPPRPGAPAPDGAVRIAVVTHGPASSKFWAIIRNGVDSAARRLDVLVDYQSPDEYSLDRMSRPDRRRGRDQAGRARGLDPRDRPRSRRSSAPCGPASRSCRSTPAAGSSAPSACSRTSARRSSGPGGRPGSGWSTRASSARSASTSRSATPAWTSAAPGMAEALEKQRRALARARHHRRRPRDARADPPRRRLRRGPGRARHELDRRAHGRRSAAAGR